MSINEKIYTYVVVKFQLPILFGKQKAQTMDAQLSLFSFKSRTFGLGQTNWTDEFWGIWDIFGQIISTHFGMFSITQPLFLQKKPFISTYLLTSPVFI